MTGIDGDRDREGWEEDADAPLETERLALADEDERLPWLEAEDDDYDEYEGSDFGHVLRLGLLALGALAAIVLGIYWVTHRTADPALTPDGSLIAADDKPYKEAPKDPGGKTFDGTGDTSFAVSEGKDKPAQIAGGPGATPAPAPAPAPSAPAKATGAGTGAKPAATASGVGVQVGAFSSKQSAEAGWTKLVDHSAGVLSGVSHRVIAGSADNGTIYRLQAVAPDAAAAQTLCGKLKAAGISCQVK